MVAVVAVLEAKALASAKVARAALEVRASVLALAKAAVAARAAVPKEKERTRDIPTAGPPAVVQEVTEEAAAVATVLEATAIRPMSVEETLLKGTRGVAVTVAAMTTTPPASAWEPEASSMVVAPSW